MIQGSDIGLWRQCSVCFVLVIAIAGCDQTTPAVAPTRSSPSTAAEPSRKAPAEPIAEIADSEMAPSADVAGGDVPSTVEQETATTEQKPVVPVSPSSPTKKPKVALAVPDPPEYVYEPQVLMSQRDADSCLVKTDASFPVGQLSDLEGQEHSLKELFGEKLTVIVFWANGNRLGREQIQRLEAETVLPFENTGLSVVAINIGDPPEQIGDLLPVDPKPRFTILLDTDTELFSKVATGRHPRTYLLDATGKVLWFDIEYSRSTARDLANAIHFYLGGKKIGVKPPVES